MPGVSASVAGVVGDGFFPPVQYSPFWMVLGIGIVLLVVAFYVVVPLLTRSHRVEREPVDTSWMPQEPTETLRGKYIDLIGEVEAAHHRDEVSLRAAHQRLSLLLRFFAYESSGIRAPQMTLADLREAHATPLGDAVEQLYPGAFSEIERGSVIEAADMARRVVLSWN